MARAYHGMWDPLIAAAALTLVTERLEGTHETGIAARMSTKLADDDASLLTEHAPLDAVGDLESAVRCFSQEGAARWAATDAASTVLADDFNAALAVLHG